MKRTIAVLLAMGLVAGAFSAPASAKKKKKKKKKPPVTEPKQVDVSFYFSNTSGGCTADAYLLVLTEATEGSNCGSALSGVPNEALIAAGQAPGGFTYNAVEGLPFVLDTSKPLTGTLQISSYTGNSANPGALGVGQTVQEITITGSSGGEATELGSGTVSYLVNPTQQIYEVPFEFELDPALQGAEFTSLAIELVSRGEAVLHGFYRTTNPASFFTVPTLVP